MDGHTFDSKLEAKVYKDLCTIHGRNNIVTQISIPLGKKRIRVDFGIILDRGVRLAGGIEHPYIMMEFADAKGYETAVSKAKLNHLEDRHGIKVRLIRS